MGGQAKHWSARGFTRGCRTDPQGDGARDHPTGCIGYKGEKSCPDKHRLLAPTFLWSSALNYSELNPLLLQRSLRRMQQGGGEVTGIGVDATLFSGFLEKRERDV